MSTTAAERSPLPREYFLLPKQNAGFEIPPYLATYEAVEKIKPPAVVKTLEKHKSEFTPKQLQALAVFEEMVKAASWYDASSNTIDEWMMLRYLRARGFDTKKALEMLEKSVKWRRETGADTWKCESCLKDPNQHMMQFVGWDLQHRPTAFMSMRWGPERKTPLPHCVATFNHLVPLMPVGVEQWVCITDFVTYSHFKDGSPKMGISVISTIQDQFPERLGMMICVNPPTMFWVLWKLFYPFIDSATRHKILFLYSKDKPSMEEHFPKIFPPHLTKYLLDSYARAATNTPPPTAATQASVAPDATVEEAETS